LHLLVLFSFSSQSHVMTSRRSFIKKSLFLTAAGLFADAGTSAPALAMQPPPDIFDAEVLDLEFWVRPRVLEVVRPASGERARILYWKDGEVIDSAYQQCATCSAMSTAAARP
jgi:hypothetical protein